MTPPVAKLIDTLLLAPGLSVEDAGRTMLEILSAGTVSPEAFRSDPRVLMGPDYSVSRYLTQLAWRALNGEYETLDEVVSGLYGVLDRNPPTLESRGAVKDPHVAVIPEARVLRVLQPRRTDSGDWEVAFEALATSGDLRDREIHVRIDAGVNPTAAGIVPYFWIHSAVALYNLQPREANRFAATDRTFFVLEPLRQVNATSIARALLCPKPQIDRLRQGFGDVNVHTIKGMLVHALLDLLIEGEDDVEAAYERVLPRYRLQLASIVDEVFDEDAFRRDALRHGRALKEFIVLNPHMRQDPQVELRRYSATLGIQGRIDAVFRRGNRLDVVELKTGKRIRPEDHAQLFIYRLLLSDYIRRAHRIREADFELTSRLLSSYDGTSTPLEKGAGFHEILDARNRLLAHTHALGHSPTPPKLPYAGYDASVCDDCVSWTASRCREHSAMFGDNPDSPDEDAALAYFRKYSALVQREAWESDRDLADLLDDSRLGFRIRNFKTIGAASCTGQEGGTFKFEFEENGSDLGPGDRVLVHAGQISSTSSFHGYVRSIDLRHAAIAIPLHRMVRETFDGKLWTIDRFPSDYTAQSSQAGLYDFLRSPLDNRKRTILGDLTVGEPTGDSVSPDEIRNPLNPSQRRAVDAVAGAPVFHLIWGPSGTGKTRVVAEIAGHIASLDRVLNRGGVLLGAFTNTAVDKMLLALIDRDPDAMFVRIGRSKDSPELAARLGDRARLCFSDDLAASAASARALRRTLDEAPVIASTAHRASTHPYVRGRTFEITLIDEASQLTEPLTLGLVMRAPRFVLIGDDRQLPPVVRGTELAISMFERLKGIAQREAPGHLSLLDRQYRMHPSIMEVSNRLFYGGALSSGVAAEDRKPPYGRPVAFVPVDQASSGRTNLAEAHAVHAIVTSLLKEVPARGIGVISPFRAQVVLLRQLLAGTGVMADTVERFQGGEREAIVLSLVRSRGTEFVFDDRRFNVAITRARRKLILVAHPELFKDTKYAWLAESMEEALP